MQHLNKYSLKRLRVFWTSPKGMALKETEYYKKMRALWMKKYYQENKEDILEGKMSKKQSRSIITKLELKLFLLSCGIIAVLNYMYLLKISGV